MRLNGEKDEKKRQIDAFKALFDKKSGKLFTWFDANTT